MATPGYDGQGNQGVRMGVSITKVNSWQPRTNQYTQYAHTVHPCTHTCTHTPIHAPIHPYMHPYTHTPMHPCTVSPLSNSSLNPCEVCRAWCRCWRTVPVRHYAPAQIHTHALSHCRHTHTYAHTHTHTHTRRDKGTTELTFNLLCSLRTSMHS